MNTILKILIVSALFALFSTTAQARNEYLNSGTNTCAQGSFDVSIEQRDDQYNYNHNSPSNNYEGTDDDRMLRFTYRKYLGTACTDEFIAEQEKQMRIKTQLEVIKECKRVPRISPPPQEFAELINMCMKIGVMFGNPETTTGGNALKFYSSVRLDIRRIGAIKDRDEIVGNHTREKVV